MTFKDSLFTTNLWDLAVYTNGRPTKPSELVKQGIPVIKIAELSRGITAQTNMVSRDVVDPKHIVRAGDLLFAWSGTIGIHIYKGPEAALNQHIFKVVAKDFIDQAYLRYLLEEQLKVLQGFVDEKKTTMGHVTIANLKTVEVSIPTDLNKQRRIASYIESIDNLLNVKEQQSKTLEDIAQTIFKSWFIDFDPVKAKMAGEKPAGMDAATSAQFPDSMEESELGLIPKGWKVKTLGDICAVTIGGLWGSDEESPENPDSYQCIRGVDMDDLKASGYAPRVPVRWDKTHNFNKRLLSGTQILIAGSGAGPVAKSLLWDDAMNRLFPKPVVFSNFVKRFECNSNEMASFVSSILRNMYESREIFTFVNGTSVPNLQDRELLACKKIAVPSEELLRAFDNINRTSVRLKFSGENSNLAAIRDSLLPRLISGELKVPEDMLAS